MEIRLMPCMYFTNCELGVLGSFFFKYKYWATWFQHSHKTLFYTVNYN
jgi:hypothetical protein